MTEDLVKIGCCGFPRRPEAYARSLRLVEVQQTFYRLPRLRTAERWRRRVPETFEFTLKAWQLITHPRTSPTYRRLARPIPERLRTRYGAFVPTEEVMAAWSQTLEIARVLRATVAVFQSPASFTPTAAHIANLRRFFDRAERGELRFAWEPRGAWPPEQVQALCRALDLIHCVDPFAQPARYGTPRYYRLHGRTGYRYRYTDGDLRQLAAWCRGPTYVLFNNLPMWDDARRFARLMARRRRP